MGFAGDRGTLPRDGPTTPGRGGSPFDFDGPGLSSGFTHVVPLEGARTECFAMGYSPSSMSNGTRLAPDRLASRLPWVAIRRLEVRGL
jgi:hypothetical protein